MRLFTAIRLSPEAEQIVMKTQQKLKSHLNCKRWQPLQNLHLTLHFLGEVKPEFIDGITESMRKHTEKAIPFVLSLGSLGAFPQLRNPKILWLGLEGETEALRGLQHQIGQDFKRFGYEEADKVYKPHITLAREPDRNSAKILQDLPLEVPPATWTVDQILLFQSELKREGAVHTVLKEFSLHPQEIYR